MSIAVPAHMVVIEAARKPPVALSGQETVPVRCLAYTFT
jgi:hypothetical protein